MVNNIENSLVTAIQDGVYPSHSRLPSEREMARRFNQPLSVIRGAFRHLEEQGLVYKIERGGTFVSGKEQHNSALTDESKGWKQLHCINFIEPERGQRDPFAFVLSDYLSGYSQFLQQNSLRVRFASVARDNPSFEMLLNAALPEKNQACIIGDCLSPAMANWLNERGVSYVFRRFSLYDPRPYPPHNAVFLNRNAAGFTATKMLLDLGHKKIAFIGPLHDERCSDKSLPTGITELEWSPHVNGYRAAFSLYGLTPPADLEAEICFVSAVNTKEAAYRLMQQRRPTAFVCGNDLMAMEVIRTLQGMGLSVPEDASVIGFDNDPAGASSDPTLTSFSGHEKMARIALERLVELVKNPDLKPEIKAIECELVQRGSVAPPP